MLDSYSEFVKPICATMPGTLTSVIDMIKRAKDAKYYFDISYTFICVVKSFRDSFVWILWLDHQARSVVAATPLADSTPSDQDSPKEPVTAR